MKMYFRVFLLGCLVFFTTQCMREGTLQQVCWPSDGSIGYASSYEKHCKTDLKWAPSIVFPLSVKIDASVPDMYQDSVEAAVRLWNIEIGPVFRIATASAGIEPRVDISWGSARGDLLAYTQHRGSSAGIIAAKVTMIEASDLHTVYRIATHELGHVLGLKHSHSVRDIMYPIQEVETLESFTYVLPSDADRRLLKRLYVK